MRLTNRLCWPMGSKACCAALELAPDRGIDNFMQVFLLFIDIIIYLLERTDITCAHEKINFYFS